MQKKRIKLALALILPCLALVSLTACGKQTVESQVPTVKVSRGDIVLSITANGNLFSPKHRKLTFVTSGKVAEVSVDEGDRVTEGQVLASLDTTSLEQAVKTLKLTVQTREVAVKSAEIDLELATNSYQQLITPYPYLTFRFALPESLDAVRVAQQRIKEAQEEFQKGLVGEQYSMAEIKDQLREAQEYLAEAETKLAWGLGAGIRPTGLDYWTLRATQIQVEKAQLALDTAQNALDTAKNELNQAKDELEKTIILAPFDGIIAKVNVKPRDVLSTMNYATTVAIEVIDPSRMELTADVDEIDIPDVKLGQKVVIEVDALPDEQFEGEVASICPLSMEEAGIITYEVKISFDVPEGSKLKAGMSATTDIILVERSNVLLVPQHAIKQDSQGNPMVEVKVNGQTQDRAVVIGISDGYQTEIVEGLDEGEAVVIRTSTESNSSPGFPFGH